MKKANEYDYDKIDIGSVFGFTKTLSIEDMDNYAHLTGDYNPLHCDEEYALSNNFKTRVVHGMLAGSLFSTLVGMICPGKKNLYLTQSLKFKSPIYPGSELTVRGEIVSKIDSVKAIVINTQIFANNKIVIEGEAKVKII
ncbi:MAG: MaoC family dehydratase [Nanoarchaeota archaeon]